MRYLRPVFLGLVALFFAAQARAAYPLVSTAVVTGASSGSLMYRVVQNPGGGDIYAAGSIKAGASNSDIWLGRYDSGLVLLSSYTFDKAGFNDEAYAVAVDTFTNNVYAAGYVSTATTSSSHDIWIARFNSSLVLQSSITINGPESDRDEVTCLRVSSGTVTVVGVSSEAGGKGYWLARFDTSFVLISSANFYQNNNEAWDFVETAGGIFVAGSRAPNWGVSNDTWIGKFDASLVFVTSAAFDGPSSQSDQISALVEDGAGGVYAGGFVYTPTLADEYIARYDSNLVRVGSATINGPGNLNEILWGMTRTAAGNILVAGSYGESAGLGGLNIIVAEYDSNLAKISSTVYTSPGNNQDLAYAVMVGANQDVYVAGWTTNAGSQDMWLGRFSTNPAYGILSPGSFVGTAQSQSAVLWTWADASATETGYRVMAGTVNVSGDLAADTTFWLQSGLAVNTSSGALFAQAFNSTGTADSGALTRYSLADVPAGFAASGVTAASATISWTGSATLYQLERSTGAVFVLLSSGPAVSYGDTSLSPASTYYYRVLGYNGDSIATAYASSITVVTLPTAVPPSAPSAFAGTAQSTSSILWSWTDNSSDETGFRIMSGAVNVSGDLAADATTWLQAGLAVNTSSGALFARAFNSTGTADSGSLTRYSLAETPALLASSGVTAASATITWAGSASSYRLERSTGGAFVLVSSGPAAFYGDTTLTPSSTYFYRVLGYNGDSVATAYASSITVVTLPGAAGPAAPTLFAGTAQSTGSILWSWTDNSSDETGFRVLFGTVNVSGDLAVDATTWLQTGLGVNTSSGSLFARAFNSTGTADSGSLTRYSLAAVPASLSSSSVFQSSVTVTWTAGNPAGTVFELESSTGGAFVLVYSSLTASYADSGLSAASTYFYRVRALNGDSVATAYASSIAVVTMQVPAPLAPSGFAGAAQSAASILWSWTDNASNEAGYRVLSGTINVSGDLAANATTWLQGSLGANTAYGPYLAQAFNGGGTANSGSASRTTLADDPSALVATGVYQTSATLSWNAGVNPAGTTFELERSTGTGYGLQFAGAATYYFDAYLTPSATHFYRVRALNSAAVATAYASSIAVVALPAPPLPGSAGTPAGTALGTSSATWTWVLASGATTHYLFRPSDNSYLGASVAGPFVQTALSPNTAYGLRAAGINVGGTGPLSPSATVYTLAAAPSAAVVSSITAASLLPMWGLNGNPASTVAQLDRSTTGVVYSTLTAGMVTSYADPDLLGCTTYYYRVRNLNGDGLATAYSSFQGVTANTNPSPPAGLTASANAGGTVSLAWSPSPTEGVTGYRLYWDSGSGTVSYGAALAVLGSTVTTFTTGVLTSSASYTFALRTAHRCGVVESTGAIAMSGAAAAAATVRAAIKEPDSGKRIHGNRVTILGELIAGTPSDVQQVTFQFKLSSSTVWDDIDEANVNHSNPDYSFPYFIHVDVTALAAGSYDLRAVAYDRNGIPDSSPPAVRVVVDPIAPEISEGTTVDGKIKKDQGVSNVATSVVETCGSGTGDPAVRVTIPAGAVNTASTTVSVISNPAITTAAPAGQTFVGSAIKIDLANGQTALNGTAAITLTYPDTVRFPSLLNIYYLNEATGQWSRDFNSTVNTASRTVTGNTPHFSTFALMLGTSFAADLNSVQAYPVPYKPNSRNTDEGGGSTGIFFANLAMGSEIKIYTMTGRLVASLDTAPVTGTIRWDARTQDGRDVASGAYFAVIKTSSHKPVVKKLVIIR